MKTWTGAWGSLDLGRFPVDDEDPSLQAWSGADRLLALWLGENLGEDTNASGPGPSTEPSLTGRHLPGRTLLILNDAWGALCCLGIHLGFRVVHVSDSWMSFQACRENLARNGLDSRCLTMVKAGGDQSWIQDLDLLSALAPGAEAVLLRMPRNLDLLAWQLSALAELSGTVALECPLVLGASDKELVPRSRQLLDRSFRSHQLSRGDFKAHLAVARTEDAMRPSPGNPGHAGGDLAGAGSDVPAAPGQSGSWPRRIPVPGHEGLDMVNWPGVFSRDGIDQAGLFLLETLAHADLSAWVPHTGKDQPLVAGAPAIGGAATIDGGAAVSGADATDGHAAATDPAAPAGLPPLVADLGCGNGLLSLGLARIHPGFRYLLADECAAALDSARSGHALLDHGVKTSMEFLWTHSLAGVADHSVDLVLCNPPFHTQGGQGLGIAAHMFADAARVLQPGGSLVVVANRHLGHHRNLEAWFTRVDVIADNGNFVVLRGTNK